MRWAQVQRLGSKFRSKVHWCSENPCQEKEDEAGEVQSYLAALCGCTRGSTTKSKGTAVRGMVTDHHSMAGKDPRCCFKPECR